MEYIVKKKEFHFLSSNRVNEIYGIMWIPQPKKDIKAILQISHGMVEHIERYNHFANFMAKQGILVVGNNHMGHGKSVSNKEDFGYFGKKIKGCKDDVSCMIVKDLFHVTSNIKKHYKNTPYFLLGHSMGSFLARRYIMNYASEINGVIIMGTNNQAKSEVVAGLGIIKIFSLLMGERHRSELLNKIMFGEYNNKIKCPKTKNDWICSNNLIIDRYEKDEACGYIFTMNGLNALLSTIWYIEKTKNIKKIPKSLSILINAGQNDPVGGYGKGVQKVYKLYKKMGITDISLKLYKNMRHEILNETGNEMVYDDIYTWIKKRVKEM